MSAETAKRRSPARTYACGECVDGHPVDEATDCNCSCGHSEEYVAMGGTWYSVAGLDDSNPYAQTTRQ